MSEDRELGLGIFGVWQWYFNGSGVERPLSVGGSGLEYCQWFCCKVTIDGIV
jgi:hypothetical protein